MSKKKKKEQAQEAFERKRLQENIMKLRKEIKTELSQRSLFQLERDKITAFWDITKQELSGVEGKLRDKERELEEIRERHSIEIKVFKQKLRHLLYEQKITLDRLKIENENALKLQSDEFHQKHLQIKTDIRKLKQFLKQQELSHNEHVKEIRLSQEMKITELRESFERELKQIQVKYQSKMKDLREEMEEETKKEVLLIEKQKNNKIKSLMDEHQKSFEDIKKYYKTITENNLHIVEELNKKVNEMKEYEVRNEDLMFEIAQSNKNLSEPLMMYLSEVNRLRHELANYNTDKITLESKKKKLKQVEKQLEKVKWEYEILFQSFNQLSGERNQLYSKYENIIHEVQQKTLFKNQLLDKKVQALQDELTRKDLEIKEVLKLSKLSETDLENIKRNINE